MGVRFVQTVGGVYRWAQGNALRTAFLTGLVIATIGCCVPRTEPAHDPGVIGDAAIRVMPARIVVGFPLVIWSSPDVRPETAWDFGNWPLRRFFVLWANIWLCGLPALLGLLAHRANTVVFPMPRLLATYLLTWLAYPLLVAPLLIREWTAVGPRSLLIAATIFGRVAHLTPAPAVAILALMAIGWSLFAFPPRPYRLPIYLAPEPRFDSADAERMPMR